MPFFALELSTFKRFYLKYMTQKNLSVSLLKFYFWKYGPLYFQKVSRKLFSHILKLYNFMPTVPIIVYKFSFMACKNYIIQWFMVWKHRKMVRLILDLFFFAVSPVVLPSTRANYWCWIWKSCCCGTFILSVVVLIVFKFVQTILLYGSGRFLFDSCCIGGPAVFEWLGTELKCQTKTKKNNDFFGLLLLFS